MLAWELQMSGLLHKKLSMTPKPLPIAEFDFHSGFLSRQFLVETRWSTGPQVSHVGHNAAVRPSKDAGNRSSIAAGAFGTEAL